MPEEVKDFTASAENLSNPDEVGHLLQALHAAQDDAIALHLKLRETAAELVEALDSKQLEIAAIELDLKGDAKRKIVGAIERYGSYQDTERGWYAVRYRQMRKTYHVDKLREHFARFAELCIEEMVNVAALQGQVKGKLLTEDELRRTGVITEAPTYATYVR